MSRVMYEQASPLPPPRRPRTGCWVTVFALALLALLIGGVAAIALYWAGEPNSIQVTVAPSQIQLSAPEQVSFQVRIQNVGLDPVTVTGIGLEPELLAGTRVVGSQPAYRSITQRSYPVYGEWQEFRLDTLLSPGATLEVSFTLEGVQPGMYETDLTVWIESDLLGVQVARAARATLDVEVR